MVRYGLIIPSFPSYSNKHVHKIALKVEINFPLSTEPTYYILFGEKDIIILQQNALACFYLSLLPPNLKFFFCIQPSVFRLSCFRLKHFCVCVSVWWNPFVPSTFLSKHISELFVHTSTSKVWCVSYRSWINDFQLDPLV